jgi:hypothetical protein
VALTPTIFVRFDKCSQPVFIQLSNCDIKFKQFWIQIQISKDQNQIFKQEFEIHGGSETKKQLKLNYNINR